MPKIGSLGQFFPKTGNDNVRKNTGTRPMGKMVSFEQGC